MESNSPSPEGYDPYEFRPTPEDWAALQGGMPRVFRDPHSPNARWIVLHVYDEHGSAEPRFQSGAIVDTLPPDPSNVPLSRLRFQRKAEEGHLIERDIIVPSCMRRAVHGDYCESRSASAGGEAYRRVRNQREYEACIENLRGRGFQELRYGVDPSDNKLKLMPMPQIRNPRPLDKK